MGSEIGFPDWVKRSERAKRASHAQVEENQNMRCGREVVPTVRKRSRVETNKEEEKGKCAVVRRNKTTDKTIQSEHITSSIKQTSGNKRKSFRNSQRVSRRNAAIIRIPKDGADLVEYLQGARTDRAIQQTASENQASQGPHFYGTGMAIVSHSLVRLVRRLASIFCQQSPRLWHLLPPSSTPYSHPDAFAEFISFRCLWIARHQYDLAVLCAK